MKIASWNVNSIRARLEHVTTWLKANRPDVLFLQELKTTEFPATVFTELGYESAAVTQKGYNGVAVLSLTPIETISTALAGDGDDTHARFLEMTIQGIRMVNIYLPNGNPVGTEKFAYKLAWMERLGKEMSAWLKTGCAGADRRRLQCHSRRHRLPQACLVDPRCIVSARAARTIPGISPAWLCRRLSVASSGRNRTVHLLGLLSLGIRAQSRHPHRPLPVIAEACRPSEESA